MTTSHPLVIDLNDESRSCVLNIISKSHEKPMDFSTVLSWDKGVDKSLLPKKPEHSWIYGTSHYDALTVEQVHESLWLENARDVSMFITLEQAIPPLYMGYINAFPGQLSSEIYEYLMIFSKEEIVHTLVFTRYMKLAGLPLFSPPDGLHELLTIKAPKMHPVAGIMITLIIEWVAELSAMYVSQTEDVDPLTREMYYQHHIDESRHIAFGRWVSESYLEKASEPDAIQIRILIQELMARMIPQFTYNPEIANYMSFKYPISIDDKYQIELLRNSSANLAINEKRFAPLYSWLRKLEIM
jgi:hypothetical protein